MRMTASARSAERAASADDELAVARLRERAVRLVAPERAAEAARDAGRGAQRGRQPRAARGLDHDRVELLVPGDLIVDRGGARAPARVRERDERREPVELLPRSRAAPRAPRPRARAARGSRRGRSGRRSRTGARARRGRGSMSTSPSPSSCTSASRTGVRELPKRFASDAVRSRSPGPNSPERIASRSSSDTRRELVGLGVIGEAALKECIQNHAAPPNATRNRRHFAFKRGGPPTSPATYGVWPGLHRCGA